MYSLFFVQFYFKCSRHEEKLRIILRIICRGLSDKKPIGSQHKLLGSYYAGMSKNIRKVEVKIEPAVGNKTARNKQPTKKSVVKRPKKQSVLSFDTKKENHLKIKRTTQQLLLTMNGAMVRSANCVIPYGIFGRHKLLNCPIGVKLQMNAH